MSKNIIRKLKKTISGFIASAIAINMFAIMPIAEEAVDKYPYAIFAGSSIEGAITVNACNFCVNGNVATNGTIISNGNMNINGAKKENAKIPMIYIPKKINHTYFSGNNVEIYFDDYSYEDTNINISNPIDVNGEFELTGNVYLNTAIKATEDVLLNGEVKNTDNSVIYSEFGDIIIDSTNVNLNGLVYAPYGEVNITAQNLNLNNVIIISDTMTFNCPNVNANYSDTMAEFVGTETEQELGIISFGFYNKEEHSIDLSWITTCDNSNFEIFVADDNIEYVSCDVTSDNTYQYFITEDFERRYFKVSVTDEYGETITTEPLVATKNGDKYKIDFIDSDEDGLPDIHERTFNTNVNKIDTDEDGLTDYQEIVLSLTSPIKYDSVIEMISDSEVDSDNDNLNTSEELELGTDPNKEDTDADGISDYNEVFVYITDPLNPDTDNDSIYDGDELKIGLAPLDPKTFDVPDAEYRCEQTVSANSEAFTNINTDENPYNISIDIVGTGYAERNLHAVKSGYSETIANGAILGIAPELSYAGSMDKAVLKFKISDAYTNNEENLFPEEETFSGIKRLNIFKYNETINMLLPVETIVDIENNMIYTEVEELGTYCVMDLEKWLVGMGFDPEDYQPQPMLMSFSDEIKDDFSEEETQMICPEYTIGESSVDDGLIILQDMPALLSNRNEEHNELIDIVFLFQSAGTSVSDFVAQKQMIADAWRNILLIFPNARVSIIEYGINEASFLLTDENSIWFDTSEEVVSSLNKMSYTTTSIYCNRGAAFSKMLKSVDFRESAGKFVFQVTNGNTTVGDGYFDQLDLCAEREINYSEIRPEGWYYISSTYGQMVEDAIENTNGISLIFDDETAFYVFEHVRSCIDSIPVKFDAILPTGWKKIQLDDILSPYSGTNSDNDIVSDWDEVNTDLLEWDAEGNVVLPSVFDCITTYSEEGGDILEWLNGVTTVRPYIISGFLSDTYTLPIHSDPTSEDTDGDGLLDYNRLIDNDGNIIAPIDPDKLKINGSDGLWSEHYENVILGENTQTTLDGWYDGYPFYFALGDVSSSASSFTNVFLNGFEVILDNVFTLAADNNAAVENWVENYCSYENYVDIEEMETFEKGELIEYFEEINVNFGVEGFYELFYLLNSYVFLGELNLTQVELNEMLVLFQDALISISEGDNFGYVVLEMLMDALRSAAKTPERGEEIMTAIGSRFLNFKTDESQNTIHSQHKTWQAAGGYSTLYDDVFKHFTNENMNNLKIPFSVGNTDYIIWAWKGDYLNLGAGSEVGIYYRPNNVTEIINSDSGLNWLDQYFTDYNLALPMSMYLYNYNGNKRYENIVSWEPDFDQWWITGFNPEYFGNVDVNKQTMVTMIDFSSEPEKFAGLCKAYEEALDDSKEKWDENVILDYSKKLMWIYW